VILVLIIAPLYRRTLNPEGPQEKIGQGFDKSLWVEAWGMIGGWIFRM
jgi:hypothetical protein